MVISVEKISLSFLAIPVMQINSGATVVDKANKEVIKATKLMESYLKQVSNLTEEEAKAEIKNVEQISFYISTLEKLTNISHKKDMPIISNVIALVDTYYDLIDALSIASNRELKKDLDKIIQGDYSNCISVEEWRKSIN